MFEIQAQNKISIRRFLINQGSLSQRGSTKSSGALKEPNTPGSLPFNRGAWTRPGPGIRVRHFENPGPAVGIGVLKNPGPALSSIPGLSHLAKNFPNKKEWPTIILIGRDCAQLQKHLQYVSSEDKHQLAVQTPLDWTIMDKPADSTLPLQTSSFVGLTAVNDAPPSTPRPIDASEIWVPEDSQEKREHYLSQETEEAIIHQQQLSATSPALAGLPKPEVILQQSSISWTP